jgi:hypothetical protein
LLQDDVLGKQYPVAGAGQDTVECTINLTRFRMHLSLRITSMLAALAAAGAAHAAEPAQVFIDNGELNYIGLISAESKRLAFSLYAAQEKKPTVFHIRSRGGATDAGIELGQWVHREGVTVKVLELCFSSCANYVFTAARNKIVSNFAVVGYHGGLSSEDFTPDKDQEAMFAALPAEQRDAARKQFIDQIKAAIAPKIRAETAFFDEIGVQQRVTTLGQTPYYEQRYGQAEAIGWSYSVADFARLGVNNITVVNPPWKPRSLTSNRFVFLADVKDAPRK